jgi:hypothetical protein
LISARAAICGSPSKRLSKLTLWKFLPKASSL